MKSFETTIRDEHGLHARPAGLLVKEAQQCDSELTLECRGKSANLKKLLAVMGLGIKCGDIVKITATGEHASDDLNKLQKFLEKNF